MSTAEEKDEAVASNSHPTTDPLSTDANTLCSCMVCDRVIDDAKACSVQCSKCLEWSHVKCTMHKDVFDLLAKISKKDSGKKKAMVFVGSVAYMCATCQVLLNSSTTPPSKEKARASKKRLPRIDSCTQTSTNVAYLPAKPSCSTTAFTATSSSVPAITVESTAKAATNDVSQAHVHKENGTRTDVLRPICYRYKQGKCPHGKTGNRIVNGQKCSFAHPRKCIRYCRFGQDRDQGCNGPCDYFHPILCRYSVKYRKCYTETCTYAHLAGTERYKKDLLPSQNFHQHRSNFQNHPGPEPRSFPAHVKSSKPGFQKGRDEGFRYNQREFPSLPVSQPDRMDELSSSIKQLQSCVNYIMQSFHPNAHHHFANTNFQAAMKQPQQLFNNVAQPATFSNNLPTTMFNHQPTEAKN